MLSNSAPLTLTRMTTRNLYRRPMRTCLTAIGVAIGVVAIVAFTTLVRGMWRMVDDSIHLDGTGLLVFQSNIAADILSILDENEMRAKLTAVPGVDKAVATLWHVLPVANRPFCLMLGMRREDLDDDPSRLLRGRYPTRDDELLVGTIAAKHVLQKDVGETLNLLGETYTITGVFQTGVVIIDGAIIMSLPRLQRLAAKEEQVTMFQIRLDPDADPANIADEIERRYPEVVAVGGAEEYHKADQGLLFANGMVWGVSFIAIVIGAIIVANTMWMTVLERTREIGVLRAVGWSRRLIIAMIILEAAGIGVLAALIGCPAGVGLAKLAASLPVTQQFLRPVFDATPFLLALAISVVLSVLGALLPAWRASRISPAEALRYE